MNGRTSPPVFGLSRAFQNTWAIWYFPCKFLHYNIAFLTLSQVGAIVTERREWWVKAVLRSPYTLGTRFHQFIRILPLETPLKTNSQ